MPSAFRVFQGNSSTFPIGKAYNIRSTWNSDGKANFLAYSPGISVGIIEEILMPYVFPTGIPIILLPEIHKTPSSGWGGCRICRLDF